MGYRPGPRAPDPSHDGTGCAARAARRGASLRGGRRLGAPADDPLRHDPHPRPVPPGAEALAASVLQAVASRAKALAAKVYDMGLLNQVPKAILRSPPHATMSRRFLRLSFQGRKTGRGYH